MISINTKPNCVKSGDIKIVFHIEFKRCIIILGQPFLGTGRALIDVQKVKLTLRIVNETQEINVFWL